MCRHSDQKSPPRHPPAPAASRAKMSNDNRGSSAHANGGAAGVKKRFSLAARHRFFGQAPKKWGRMAAGGNDHLPTYRRTRTRRKTRRGNPRRGFPLGPPPALYEAKREFRALRSAARGAAPGPRPLFCKKAGQKTFRRQSTSGPNPSPLGRVIQSVREADTLAAEWHLPREWERRVGPETSRGRHHPISVFLWGSTPFLWARPKKWGGTGRLRQKLSATYRRVPETQRPGGDGTPPLQVCRTLPRKRTAHRGAGRSICAQGLFVVV